VEIDEVAARLVRQYWALMVVCIVLPVLAIMAITIRQPSVYAAEARIITGSTVPASSAQAGAIVSQVQGIATSRTAVSRALFAAGVARNLTKFITSDISVAGLGTSQVVDLTVTDVSPHVATTVARVLAAEVVSSINNVGQSGLSAALQAVDKEIVRLTQARSVLAAKASSAPKDQQTQAKLAGLEEVIANFTGNRNSLLIQTSSQGLAKVIDKPALPNRPQSTALPQKLGLAGVLGVVVAILISSIAEAVRPTVPGARRVGRRLGAPTLGQLNSSELTGTGTPALSNMALRLQLAAAHASVGTVALVDIDGRRPLSGLASGLERALTEFSTPTAILPAALIANHANSGGTSAVGGLVGTGLLMKNLDVLAETRPLRIYPMGQMKHMAGSGAVGLLVLSGPVARVSRITALDDLVTSSGWPILGVVAVPRARRRARSDEGRSEKYVTLPPNGVGGGQSNGANGANGAGNAGSQAGGAGHGGEGGEP
jgi:capsular polysaccharide biosynthesis protein